MRYLLSLFCALGAVAAVGCGIGPRVAQHTAPFKIGKAYAQQWVAGVPEGGRGTHFYIQLEEPAPGVRFQKVYFQNGSALLKPMADTSLTFVARLSDTLSSEVIMDSDPVREADNKISDRVRFKLKEHQATISYWFQKELRYHTIDTVRRMEPLHYPAPPPN